MTDVFQRYATWLRHSAGWKRLAVAFILGILATVALAPLHFVPSLIVSFSGLVWLLDGVSGRRNAFLVGWSFGFGFFIAGIYWIGFATLVDAQRNVWLLPFASLGLPVGLAIFSGVAALLHHWAALHGAGRIMTLAFAWTAVEWLRSIILTGFPWNLVGYAWMGSDSVSQSASFVGVHGLGLFTVMVSAAAASLFDRNGNIKGYHFFGGAMIGVAVIWCLGAWRIAETPIADVPDVKLRIVQANIAQHHKWKPSLRRRHLERYLRLSSAPNAEKITHMVWPETAVPFFLDRHVEIRQMLGELVEGGRILITGAPRATPNNENPFRVWNSVQAIDEAGDIVGVYDKFHLVPFGEYVPFRALLGSIGLEPLVAGRGDFQRGSGPRSLAIPGLPPVSPLICYEAIFPGNVVDPANRPAWLLNLTNDAWFGQTSGPHQHLAMTRLRAIEEGIPLVRAANTGISAIIDPLGRVREYLHLGEEGVIDGKLPKALAGATLYSHMGEWPVLTAFLLFLFWVGCLKRRERFIIN